MLQQTEFSTISFGTHRLLLISWAFLIQKVLLLLTLRLKTKLWIQRKNAVKNLFEYISVGGGYFVVKTTRLKSDSDKNCSICQTSEKKLCPAILLYESPKIVNNINILEHF